MIQFLSLTLVYLSLISISKSKTITDLTDIRSKQIKSLSSAYGSLPFDFE